MPSPFPGMDPFLEAPAYWPDFHSTFINYWRESIADALPADYEAGLGERVYLVETMPEHRKRIGPDVAITKGTSRADTSTSSTSVATLEPITIPVTLLDGPRESYIEILHHPDRTLVAVLELLSPANKELPGRTEYLANRNALMYQHVHLVELDLLQLGERVPLSQPLPQGDCYYFVARGDHRPDCQVYTWSLADPLPRLPVPLRAPDPDLIIDMASVFTTAYDRGRFGKRLNYTRPCPLGPDKVDLKWINAVLAR